MSLFSEYTHSWPTWYRNCLLNQRDGMHSRYAMRHSRTPLSPLPTWVFRARSLIIILKYFIIKPPHICGNCFQRRVNHLFCTSNFISRDEYIPSHLYHHYITLLHSNRIPFVNLPHKTLLKCEVQCTISPQLHC